jgi:hypothetical protein
LLARRRTRGWRRTLSIGLGSVCLLSGCTAGWPPPGPPNPPGDATLYVIERGWHTDIGLPIEEVAPPLATLLQGFAGLRTVSFGFGERAFYAGHQHGVGDTLAALLPSQSAMLMTLLNTEPQAAFGADHVVTLHVTRAGVAAVETRLWNDLEHAPDSPPKPLAAGPYPGSLFYATRTTYDLLNTCNTWTAEMLRTAGLPVAVGGVIFVGQVMGMARRLARQQGG